MKFLKLILITLMVSCFVFGQSFTTYTAAPPGADSVMTLKTSWGTLYSVYGTSLDVQNLYLLMYDDYEDSVDTESEDPKLVFVLTPGDTNADGDQFYGTPISEYYPEGVVFETAMSFVITDSVAADSTTTAGAGIILNFLYK